MTNVTHQFDSIEQQLHDLQQRIQSRPKDAQYKPIDRRLLIKIASLLLHAEESLNHVSNIAK